ncbi:MAG: GDP-mannose 4,6-dehydratase [Treponemataceae bacterium]
MNLAFYKGKKIFLTGHTGFKGAWLTRILLMAGADVTGYSLDAQSPSLFEKTSTKNDITHISADIRDGTSLSLAIKNAKPDIIFHLAAQPIVRTSYKNPVEDIRNKCYGNGKCFGGFAKNSNGKKFYKYYYGQGL